MRRSVSFAVWFAMLLAMAAPALAQISVTATNPSAAPQGTLSLNVTVSGNGFKKGAKAKFVVTGTTDTGGVTVNSTSYNGSSTLTANITIANGATLANYDVQVQNTDGRTGVGSELFTVTVYGTPIGCSTTGTPAGFADPILLNPVNATTGAATITTGILGNAIRVRPVDLSGNNGTANALVVFVSSGSSTGTSGQTGGSSTTYIFLLDPATGAPLATNPVDGSPLQNPIPILTGFAARQAAVGDVNNDGIPDFVLAGGSLAYLFVGKTANNRLSYTAYAINSPATYPLNFGSAVAMGDLDGVSGDELVIAADSEGSKGKGAPAAVYIYKYTVSGPTLYQTVSDPTGSNTSWFGHGVAIGNVAAGDISNNLIVGAYNSAAVYVFHPPFTGSTTPTNLALAGSGYGWGVAAYDVDLDSATISDLILTTTTSAAFYTGAVSASSTPYTTLQPVHSLTGSWDWPAMDVGTVGSAGAVLVGAQTANNNTGNNSCSVTVGAAHLFMAPFATPAQPTTFLFEPPSVSTNNMQFGSAVAVANGYPFVIIGEHYRTVGTTTNAGQIYVYRQQ